MGTCCAKNDVICGDKNTPLFTLKGIKIKAKVVYVYDGDTIHIVFPVYTLEGKRVERRWKCRLSGIDTPEIKTKHEEEKKQAIMIRDIVHSKLFGKTVWVYCDEFDKYGRLLVTIPTIGLGKDWRSEGKWCSTVNAWLIERGYAYKYEGGKKHTWEV